jgi:predicted transcriptional regulator
MATIMLPIHPIYANKILSGEKRYEYRRKIPKQPVELIFIYATKPIQKVVGHVYVISTDEYFLDVMWEITKDKAGISHEVYKRYFHGRNVGYVFFLANYCKYTRPAKIEDFGLIKAPQSFVYIDEKYIS